MDFAAPHFFSLVEVKSITVTGLFEPTQRSTKAINVVYFHLPTHSRVKINAHTHIFFAPIARKHVDQI